MTESNRIALECQKHLRGHLNMLNWAGQFVANISKLQEHHYEQIISPVVANTGFSHNTPEGRREYEELLHRRFRECAGFGFAKIESELRVIGADIQKDIGTSGVGISPHFYNMAERRLAKVTNRQHETDEKIRNLSNATEILRGYITNGDIDNDASHLVVHSVDVAYFYHEDISSQMRDIRLFNKIKNVKTNIVFVGANGSGKSTLAREMSAALGITNSAIMAQQPIDCDLKEFNLSEAGYSKQAKRAIRQNQKNHTKSVIGLNNLLGCLFAEYVNSAIDEKRHGADADSYGKPTLLDTAFEFWGKIIPGRKLDYDIDNETLRAINLEQNKTKYPISELSDGERTALYYVAFVVLASENQYIIVDEPENNLNLAVVNRLWDELEKLRPDCQFIYLTHNPDFVMGRRNARTLWIKNVIPNSGEWHYEELPDPEELGERLMIELVGEPRKVLFCEGGTDYNVYKILLPDYSVKAVGNNRKVIDCVRAHKRKGIFPNSAVGVLDRDFRTDDEARNLCQDSIHCLTLPAVENLLCAEELIQAVAKHDHRRNYSFPRIEEKLFNMLERNKEKLAAHYAHDFAEKQLRNITPEAGDTLKCVAKSWYGAVLPQKDDIRRAYKKRLKEIGDAINSRQYAEGLALYHCKSVITEIGCMIVNNYKDKVLSLLQENPDLRKMLIDKYIPGLSTD